MIKKIFVLFLLMSFMSPCFAIVTNDLNVNSNGYPLILKTTKSMNSKYTKVGDIIECVVVHDVYADDENLLVPQNTKVDLVVKEITRTGFTGKAGKIVLTESFKVEGVKKFAFLDDKSI